MACGWDRCGHRWDRDGTVGNNGYTDGLGLETKLDGVDVGIGRKTGMGIVTETGTVTGTDTNTGTETHTGTETSTRTDKGTGTSTGTGTRTGTETGTGTDTVTGTNTETGTDKSPGKLGLRGPKTRGAGIPEDLGPGEPRGGPRGPGPEEALGVDLRVGWSGQPVWVGEAGRPIWESGRPVRVKWSVTSKGPSQGALLQGQAEVEQPEEDQQVVELQPEEVAIDMQVSVQADFYNGNFRASSVSQLGQYHGADDSDDGSPEQSASCEPQQQDEEQTNSQGDQQTSGTHAEIQHHVNKPQPVTFVPPTSTCFIIFTVTDTVQSAPGLTVVASRGCCSSGGVALHGGGAARAVPAGRHGACWRWTKKERNKEATRSPLLPPFSHIDHLQAPTRSRSLCRDVTPTRFIMNDATGLNRKTAFPPVSFQTQPNLQ
ncbi:hypothetical protein FQN60_016715, partial [Etheostoma spectabile]